MEYEIVMGLEVHVELATASKLFCSCSTKFGSGENENVCPACSGMPGMTPVVNKRAIELGMIAATLTNSHINRTISFDKKNYFYPDLSTGYQITQWFAPICVNGYVDIETASGEKRITLKQIHIEEDAGKLVHDFRTDTSLVDYNRASIPLSEIVSNPDFRSADEVIAYLVKLQKLLSFGGVSDCKMQEGSMRCDVNLSVRKKGDTKYGTRTEVKNMNSFKAIQRAIAYESQRHIEALETKCEVLIQETRGWDDAKGESFSMRSKENAHDYRYFPNPDIAPICISDEWLERVIASIPEKVEAKCARYKKNIGLSDVECDILTANKFINAIFEGTLESCEYSRDVANWVIVELLSYIKTENVDIENFAFNTKEFAKIITMVKENKINRNVGKKILIALVNGGLSFSVESYIKDNNLGGFTGTAELEKIIAEVIARNGKSVAEYKAGNEKVIGFLVGQIMKQSAGKASPKDTNEILVRLLKA